MKKSLVMSAILLGLSLGFGGAAYALSTFAKNVAGYGQVKFTDQVTITESKLDGNDTIKVKVQSNTNTVVDKIYTIHLYLEGEEATTQTVSWTAAQMPGDTKTKTFDGLSLADVTVWDIEVTH